MANGHSSRNYLLGGTAVAVGASAVDTVVSSDIPLSAEDSKNFRMWVTASAAKEVTGITMSLQHERGAEWIDVGTPADITIIGFAADDADIDSGADSITEASHGLNTGDKIFYNCSSTGVITGLTDATAYYVIRVDANTIKLALTRAAAFAGTVVGLTQPASGHTHYITKSEYELILNIENSTDEAVLPMWPKARLVANTGANDVFTVNAVYASRRY